MSGHTIVVGCGGAGCSTVSHLGSVSDIRAVTVNVGNADPNVTIRMTDAEVSDCRGDQDLGWALASDYADEIKDAISGYSNVIVVAGMGGGTGSGTVPVVLECAKDAGMRSVSVLYIPMQFESERRSRAVSQIQDVLGMSDCTIVMDIGALQSGGGGFLPIKKAIFAAEEIACESVIRLEAMLDGPFLSFFSEKLYTVSYASSGSFASSIRNALGSPLFDTDLRHGKIIAITDATLTGYERSIISDTVCGRTGIMPEVVPGKDAEGHGMMLFIPISSRAL